MDGLRDARINSYIKIKCGVSDGDKCSEENRAECLVWKYRATLARMMREDLLATKQVANLPLFFLTR